jgi:hypothetical protein
MSMTSAALARTHAVSPEFTIVPPVREAVGSVICTGSIEKSCFAGSRARFRQGELSRVPCYERVSTRLTTLKHIGEQVDDSGLAAVPGVMITDPGWLGAQVDAAGRRYRLADRPTLGVLWWYSASSVLLGLLVAERDPGLDHVTLLMHRVDGRLLDARSNRALADFGTLGNALSVPIETVVRATGARRRALWAIATDSLANRVLWAGGSPGDAFRLAALVGPKLPTPRYVTVSGRLVVRRASCCLIYLAPGEAKCVSCPRQTPEERVRRLSHGG